VDDFLDADRILAEEETQDANSANAADADEANAAAAAAADAPNTVPSPLPPPIVPILNPQVVASASRRAKAQRATSVNPTASNG
jgi:hypothetical protein